jgi:hypothetical protein
MFEPYSTVILIESTCFAQTGKRNITQKRPIVIIGFHAKKGLLEGANWTHAFTQDFNFFRFPVFDIWVDAKLPIFFCKKFNILCIAGVQSRQASLTVTFPLL